MKKLRHNSEPKLANQGFTLIELLISIAVLVLIMVPLMNNFYRSIQMNQRAEKIQNQSVLASNLMEGLKSLSLEEILKQFAGEITDFDIITDESGNQVADDIMILEYDEATGTYVEIAVLPDNYRTLLGRGTYYFAIHGIKVGGSAYDALIRMDADTYKTAVNIMNNYPMPDAINLDQAANGLLFSKVSTVSDHTLDGEVLDTFLQYGEEYAKSLFQENEYQDYLKNLENWKLERETAEMNGDPIPAPPPEVFFDPADYPDYCDEATVKSRISKTMKITVSQATENQVKYRILYTCDWPSDSGLEKNLEYTVSDNTYSKVLENLYLFYEPSIFKDSINYHPDMIEVDNLTPDKKINLYLAKQEQNILGMAPLLDDVRLSVSSSDNFSLFSNMDRGHVKLIVDGIEDVTGSIDSSIVKTEQKDRIYDADVKIYEYVGSTNLADQYKNELYSIHSSTED
jgi:prepilin-type N-terminal cleavage/methylation domain-containing protein